MVGVRLQREMRGHQPFLPVGGSPDLTVGGWGAVLLRFCLLDLGTEGAQGYVLVYCCASWPCVGGQALPQVKAPPRDMGV